MTTASVVIIFEFAQLPRQIDGIPEEHAIKTLAPNHADQSFNEWMRNLGVRNRLGLSNFDQAHVGKPTMDTKQRIVVGTQVLRSGLTGRGVIDSCGTRIRRRYTRVRRRSR